MSTLRVVEVPGRTYPGASGQNDLDPCTAFLQDFGPGQGQLTIICWGRAWTQYWGAIGWGDLRSFILDASIGYIVGKLMLPYDVMLKRAEKREHDRLVQIVEALKDELRRAAA